MIFQGHELIDIDGGAVDQPFFSDIDPFALAEQCDLLLPNIRGLRFCL